MGGTATAKHLPGKAEDASKCQFGQNAPDKRKKKARSSPLLLLVARQEKVEAYKHQEKTSHERREFSTY